MTLIEKVETRIKFYEMAIIVLKSGIPIGDMFSLLATEENEEFFTSSSLMYSFWDDYSEALIEHGTVLALVKDMNDTIECYQQLLDQLRKPDGIHLS